MVRPSTNVRYALACRDDTIEARFVPQRQAKAYRTFPARFIQQSHIQFAETAFEIGKEIRRTDHWLGSFWRNGREGVD